MSISRLANGRWRCQVYDATTRKNVSAAVVLGLPKDQSTFDTKREAKKAREDARAMLAEAVTPKGITVKEWSETWKTDPLYQRPKVSTNVRNHANVKHFVDEHGDLELTEITKRLVSQYLSGGKRNYMVQSLRVMFSDATSVKAGELITANPFSNLGIKQSRGNAHKSPPSVAEVETMLRLAGELVSPMFRGWLTTACYTGMRPSEVDALRWSNVDLDAGRVVVAEQWSRLAETFTLPKNGQVRTVMLPPQARAVLLELPRTSEFCFTNLRNSHFQQSSRSQSWAKVQAAAGLTGKSLYLCSRHWAGWYMVNVLEMPSEDVAIQLGHTDGGELVRKLYGHRDHGLALKRLDKAFLSAHETAHTDPETGRARLRSVG